MRGIMNMFFCLVVAIQVLPHADACVFWSCSTSCSAENPSYIGDGYCDFTDYNTADCGWDGGDCCESTCNGSEYSCGMTGYLCLDPNALTTTAKIVPTKPSGPGKVTAIKPP